MTSLLLNSDENFTDDDIADEILDFLGAGSGTTQGITQNLIMHFCDSKADLERVRNEFNEVKKRIVSEYPADF